MFLFQAIRNRIMKSAYARFLLIIVFSAGFVHHVGAQNVVRQLTFNPGSPANLSPGDRINFSFVYTTSEASGVQIFIRPFSKGALAPDYSATGSPIYSQGRGEGTGYFTVGKAGITVDEVRIQMYSSDQSRLLHESYIPVQFIFGRIPLLTYRRFSAIDTQFNARVDRQVEVAEETQPPPPLDQGSTEIIIHPDGAIETIYPDGSRIIVDSDGGKTIYPAGDSTGSRVMMMQVPRALPPIELMSIEAEWMESMDAWLEFVGEQLLFRITSLATTSESIDNYMSFEEGHTSTLYERVDLRLKTLSHMMQEM